MMHALATLLVPPEPRRLPGRRVMKILLRTIPAVLTARGAS